SVADTESKPGALAYGLGCVEGIEGAIHIGKTWAIVFKADDDLLILLYAIDFNFLLFKALYRVYSVIENVQQNLFQLVFVDGRLGKIGLDVGHDFHSVALHVV